MSDLAADRKDRNMYVIALCDDEEAGLDRMEELLAQYQRTTGFPEYKTLRFQSAEALLEHIEKEDGMSFDLLFLDIFMSGKSGIEAAEAVRKRGKNVPIIFQTMSTDYALHAYEVDAVQYLVKPLDEKKFFHAMDTAFRQLQREKESQIVLKLSGGIRRLRPDEIIYCESQKNYQILYLEKEECKIRMTARELWEILRKSPQFCKCGRSFILNMNHIVLLERDMVFMGNDKKIYVPRNKIAEFKQIYFSYCFDGMD